MAPTPSSCHAPCPPPQPSTRARSLPAGGDGSDGRQWRTSVSVAKRAVRLHFTGHLLPARVEPEGSGGNPGAAPAVRPPSQPISACHAGPPREAHAQAPCMHRSHLYPGAAWPPGGASSRALRPPRAPPAAHPGSSAPRRLQEAVGGVGGRARDEGRRWAQLSGSLGGREQAIPRQLSRAPTGPHQRASEAPRHHRPASVSSRAHRCRRRR